MNEKKFWVKLIFERLKIYSRKKLNIDQFDSKVIDGPYPLVGSSSGCYQHEILTQ